MVLALVLVAVLGVGVPAAGWFATRRLSDPRKGGGFRAGYDEIDRWLADQHQLAWLERARVRKAVSRGQEVQDPSLQPAVQGLALRVLAGGFRTLRLSQTMGWVNIATGAAYAVFGVIIISVSGGNGKWVSTAIVFLLNAAVLTFAGVFYALRAPKQLRRHAERVLVSSSKDA